MDLVEFEDGVTDGPAALFKSVEALSLLSWMTPFHISTALRICCHGIINNLILPKFGTIAQLRIFNKSTKFC